jgi:hypothetical protein
MAQNNHQEGLLYFAYGSNLSTTQMQRRCPRSTPLGVAHLRGWTWIINERGYANIVENGAQWGPQDGDEVDPAVDGPADANEGGDRKHGTAPGPGVYGLVYRLHRLDEETLDVCEGVPYAYERVMLDVEWVPAGNNAADLNTGQASSTIDTTEEEDKSSRPTGWMDMETHPEEKTIAGAAGGKINVLVYVDFHRVRPSVPKQEYIGRMNLGIEEAMGKWNLPEAYVDSAMRPFIPE